MLKFKIEKDGEKWHAYSEGLPGCHTFGSTPQQAMENLKNAVQLYLEDEIEYQSIQQITDGKENISYV